MISVRGMQQCYAHNTTSYVMYYAHGGVMRTAPDTVTKVLAKFIFTVCTLYLGKHRYNVLLQCKKSFEVQPCIKIGKTKQIKVELFNKAHNQK